jgi:hypothetical protein
MLRITDTALFMPILKRKPYIIPFAELFFDFYSKKCSKNTLIDLIMVSMVRALLRMFFITVYIIPLFEIIIKYF